MSYASTAEVWKNLGKDAYNRVRSEIVGTGNGVVSTWTLDHNNVIKNSETIYTGGTAVPTSSYTIDLDEGKITGLTASSGSAVTADYDYADLPDSIVANLISSSDKQIEEETGRTYGQTIGSVEYLDVEDEQDTFFLKNYPVLTLSSVEQNIEASITKTPNWSASSQGIGNDYIANDADLEIGKFMFIDNFPYVGPNRLKVTYDYGYTTTPLLVKELSILLSIRKMTNSAVYKAIFKGQDNFTPVRLAEIETRIEELKRILKKQDISPV
ncbi:MAG: hypothetical protein ACTSUC_09600 [Promethearchaeota archaeon]